MKDNLKICPFCNGKADYSKYQKCDGYMQEGYTYRVQCSKCGALIEGGNAEDVLARWGSRGDTND